MKILWKCCVLAIAAALVSSVSGDQCPTNGTCPDLSGHDIDLSPLQGTWDTLYYTEPQGSLVADVPHFFNLSLCGAIHNSSCAGNSSVCYSDDRNTFYSLGNTSSCQYSYGDRRVKFTYSFSSEEGVSHRYGTGNVSVTLICGRTLGVPEVIQGDPHSDEVVILWDTSAACKTTTSLRYTQEAKCYHIHAFEDNGLRANFIDLTSLINPQGYQVLSSEDTSVKLLLSVCKPMVFVVDQDHPTTCNSSMACLVQAGGSLGSSAGAPAVLGEWSREAQLHMHEGLLTVEYSVGVNNNDNPCVSGRRVRVHFLCPADNQILGPHVTFMDGDACLTIVTWYTSFACGRAAIQTQGCVLTTEGGLVFNFTSLSHSTSSVNSSSSLVDSSGQPYTYSLQICTGNSLGNGCSPQPPTNTRVLQADSNGRCHSLGVGEGTLRYADGTLSLTYTHGETCHSNFARTSLITFLCPENLDGERANTSTIRFLREEDCFYQFEWVTNLACGSKTSGVSDCQFELPGGGGGTYNFAPLVGTEDQNWVSIGTNHSIACFMINPCGELTTTLATSGTGSDYCNHRHAPSACSGASVCRIMPDGSATRIGRFDLGNTSTIQRADSNVLTVLGRLGGNSSADSSNTAVIHYVCKTGDLFSPPVYVGVTNEHFYEFHWMTFAACPSGAQSGSECTVTYQGFLFNLSSIPVLSYNDTKYTYEISVCSALPSNETRCTGEHNTGASSVCQVQRSGSNRYKLGEANSTLIYEDGSLKLTYTNGQACAHRNNVHRNTTLLFICDSTAHSASVSSVTEDECEYVIEIRTKLACPPAYRASECIFFNGTNYSYDFSDLSRSLFQGNWESRGPNGEVYYINVCQPLNRLPGCNALAGACKKVVSSDGQVTYTDIGMAYDTQFTSRHRDGEERITLTYRHQQQSEQCASISTNIEFICNRSSLNSEVGPHFASGGDAQNPCEYNFLWETTGACPIKLIRSYNCQLPLPSGFTFDLSPLNSPPSSSSSNDQSNNNNFYRVTSKASNFTFDLAICGSLTAPCSNKSGVAVCQTDSTNRKHACGVNTTLELDYFDGSLYMKYGGGDTCDHNLRNRSVLINFECDRTANMSTTSPRYVKESDCAYTFEWPTPLACVPRELECLAAGGKYDLTPLLGNRHWVVDTRDLGGQDTYVIGGCRSLDFEQLSQCPQVPGLGACRYPSSGGAGSALGYLMGDIVEESEGSLRLTYHSGDVCDGGGRSMVHVHFTCEMGTGSGVPTLAPSSNNCHTHIDWVTEYACSRTTASLNWTIADPVTHHVFNFTSLPDSLSANDTAPNGDKYEYTVSLRGGTIACPSSSSSSLPAPPAACQVKIGPNCNSTVPSCVHTLGLLENTTSLNMTDGNVRVEYRNGDQCRHAAKRKADIIFECDSREQPFLEVLPENMCEYSFVVHTKLACPGDEPIGVECRVDGFHDLVAFQRMSARTVYTDDGNRVFLSVCRTIGNTGGGCDPGAGACLDSHERPLSLGKPSPRYPPMAMADNTGVVLHYIQGSPCGSDGDRRWNTTLVLICNRNVHVGVPEFVSNSDCQYTFRWESASACPTDLPASESSKTSCSLVDPYANDLVLDFKLFITHLALTTSDNHGGKYTIQLCGAASPTPPPPGCSQSDTGICRQYADGRNTTVVSANHTFSLVSHSPRVVDVIFHSGVTCESDSTRKLSAIVQMVCSNQSENAVPVLVSDEDCELRFVWRNQSFCAGESAAGGCSAVDATTGYVYSLDGLLAQNWTGLVSPTSSNTATSKGGSFSFSICRNLNPFSYSGIKCSTPSAVCWHTADGRHINLGRSSFRPDVIRKPNATTIHVAYNSGDICNGTRQYHTDLYIHCATNPSSPILFYDTWKSVVGHDNCSFVITMDSPLACATNLSSSLCTIQTGSGVYNFTDIATSPKKLKIGSETYSVCLCGNSSFPGCTDEGISNVTTGHVSFGNFRNLSVSSSTGGPKFSYYGGSQCPGHGSTRYQSWLFMECNRSANGDGHLTLLESASSACMKVFAWYTNRACLSQQLSCSVSVTVSSSTYFFDFTPLHSHAMPWKVKTETDTYYINICGEIVNLYARDIASCGGDSAVCVKPSDGTPAYSIAAASTQQMYYNRDGIVFMFTGPESTRCRGASRVSITMTGGIHGLSLDQTGPDCHYSFTWSTPFAYKQKPQTFKNCEAITPGTSGFSFHPLQISAVSVYSVQGRLSVSICGSPSNCSDRDAAVCLDKHSTIAYRYNKTIMVDGYQMLVNMDGPNNQHAIVRVICQLDSTTAVDSSQDTLKLDNVAQNGDHRHYYFTLYTNQGKGCDFIQPTGAPTIPSAGPTGAKTPTSSKKATGALVAVTVISLIVLLGALVAIFYKKERRDKVRKAFAYLTIGRSSAPVRYVKLSTRDEEQSLMADQSEEEEDVLGEEPRKKEGRATGGEGGTEGENSDEELINL